MQFSIRHEQANPSEVRRVATELVSYARDKLAQREAEPDKAVHEARKCMKKLRALLRLIRNAQDRQSFREDDRAIRDFAAQLGRARDSAILIESLKHLDSYFKPYIKVSATRALHLALEQRYRDTMLNFLVSPDSRTLQQGLDRLQSRLDGWNMEKLGRDTLVSGIERSYRDGRRAWKTAAASPVAANVHAWRRQVKYLWYHSRLLLNWDPETLKPFVEQLNSLGELLGTDHDLAVLIQTIHEQHELCADRRLAELIIGLAKARQTTLLDSAMRLADNIYSMKPGHFVALLTGITATSD